jgi:nucleotide-binding universal stress UspA family protein
MYRTILVTLESTTADRPVIDHVKSLAKAMNSTLILLHVATGPRAPRSGHPATCDDFDAQQTYLRQVQDELETERIHATTRLAYGDPLSQIANRLEYSKCDLVAMSTCSWANVRRRSFLGITADSCGRHFDVPILLPTGI